MEVVLPPYTWSSHVSSVKYQDLAEVGSIGDMVCLSSINQSLADDDTCDWDGYKDMWSSYAGIEPILPISKRRLASTITRRRLPVKQELFELRTGYCTGVQIPY